MDRVRWMFSQSAEEENDLIGDYISTADEAVETSNNDDRRNCDDDRLSQQSSYTPPNMRVSLTWTNVSARVGSRRILGNISGIAKPGELLAVMGESGAGKTTLLNIIGDRPLAENIRYNGEIEMNGSPIKSELVRRFAGFVYRDDVLPPLLTCWEYLWFHAQLRMNGEKITDKTRRSRIDALLAELSLVHCADTLIGDPRTGKNLLSGGERKRLSLAAELIVNPAVLFLDEPTSGLDSFLAEGVVQTLKTFAKQSAKTIVLTVHQPSSEIFSHFDRLLLLSPDGRVCFQGTNSDCLRFFAASPIKKQCPNNFNPADFYMDVICRRFRDRSDVITDAYKASEYSKIVTSEIEAVLTRHAFIVAPALTFLSEIRPASIGDQLKVTAWRAATLHYRNPAWTHTRLLDCLIYPFIIGLVFFGLGLDPVGVANRCGALVQLTGINVWQNLDYIENLPTERSLLLRDYAVGLYTPWVYFLTRQIVELPFMFLLTVISTTIIYILPLMWQTTGISGWLIAIGTGFLIALAASSIGYIFGFWTENYAIIASVCRPVLVVLMLCNGFWVNNESIMTSKYLSWLPYLSPFFYGSENMFIGEWADVTLKECDRSKNSETRCFENGTEVLKYYNFDSSHLWRNFWLLLVMALCCRLFALAILTYRTRQAIKHNRTTNILHTGKAIPRAVRHA